jgi:class 3 adenylate cyclase
VAALNQVVGDSLDAGREAIRKHAWPEAFELLSDADEANALSAQDLEALAEAGWWIGHLDACILARERSYSSYVEAGDPRSAARVAMGLAKDHYSKQSASVGSGWVRHAERLLEQQDCVEQGYLARLHAVIAFEGIGDFDGTLAEAQRALEIAERFGDRDLQAIAVNDRARALVAKGQVAEGLSLLDEATSAAVSGELGPMATAIVYCNMITTFGSLGDYRRAGEWSDVAKRWCERQEIAGFPGMCRVHRAEIMRLRGAWPEAEREARRACDELRNFNLEAAAEAFYEVGEIRLRVGDLEAAKEAFGHANELGRDPQPGLARLRLAEGKPDSATACMRRALDEESRDLARARLLPAEVELSIATGDLERARAATEELEAIAGRYEGAALAAAGVTSRGRLGFAEGEAGEAVRSLRKAVRLWRELDLPYDGAEARLELARAYRAEGDHDSALLELRSAKATFEQLGALPQDRSAAELLQTWHGKDAAGEITTAERAVKTLMFTDIVKSTKLVDAIGDEAWTDVVRWHDRTLRSLFAEHGGHEIDHAGDGFFVVFDEPAEALACAVGVQRTLAGHRQSSGFAPPVRVGLHTVDATRSGGAYRGRGVHEAARIAGIAEGGQILASAITLASTGSRFRASSSRKVALEGISEPVEVLALEWR